MVLRGTKKKIILCSSTAPHLQRLIQAIGSKYLLRIIFSQFLSPVWQCFREGEKCKKFKAFSIKGWPAIKLFFLPKIQVVFGPKTLFSALFGVF